YVTTQMFFNNEHYFHFLERCKTHGVHVPIVPGLKPISSKRQLTMIPSIFNVEIPVDLYNEMQKAKTEKDCEKVGEEWLLMQCRDLLKQKVPVLHFYTLGKPQIVYNVLKKLF
ncbi:MAG: methylenetetrahydrofolate reductase, partial [Bacteroidetes bacterium]|nr:methylenetetrahydrofolate reductase [Bacteroidota bacterium]